MFCIKSAKNLLCFDIYLKQPRKRPLLQRGKQRVQLRQRGAVGGFEGFDGLDAPEFDS